MAGTITVIHNVAVRNGNASQTWTTNVSEVTQTNEGVGNPGFVDVGTSEENISFGDITPGYVTIEMVGTANYVEFGPSVSGAMQKIGEIRPGLPASFYLASGVTLRMKAITAAVKLMVRGVNT